MQGFVWLTWSVAGREKEAPFRSPALSLCLPLSNSAITASPISNALTTGSSVCSSKDIANTSILPQSATYQCPSRRACCAHAFPPSPYSRSSAVVKVMKSLFEHCDRSQGHGLDVGQAWQVA